MRTFEFPYGLDVPFQDGRAVDVFSAAGAIVTPTLESAVQATRVLTESGDFADGETVTIVLRDGTSLVYTLKTALTPTRGEVLIGANTTAALVNLARAINGTGTPGTDYAKNTPPATGYVATSDATTLTVKAINMGDAYNAAMANFAESGASTSWAAVTDGVDTPDWQEAVISATGEAAYANMSAAPMVRNDSLHLCPIATQLTAKRHRLRIKENAGTVFEQVSIELVTTDHPAAGKPNGCLYAGVLDDPTDLATDGTYVEIPNESHADDGDWLGGEYSVPDTDDIVKNDWIVVFDPDTGNYGIAQIKSYDYTDAGFGTNQGRVTFVVGSGIKIPTTLRPATRLYYRVYAANSEIVTELTAAATAQIETELTDRLLTAATKTIMDSLGAENILVTAGAGPHSTGGFADSDLTGVYAADILAGRHATFMTGALRGLRVVIVTHDAAAGDGTIALETTAGAVLPSVPAAGVTLRIH